MKDNISVIGCMYKVKGICVPVTLWLLLYGLVWVCYDKYLFWSSERFQADWIEDKTRDGISGENERNKGKREKSVAVCGFTSQCSLGIIVWLHICIMG